MILLFGKNIGQLGVVPQSESVVLPVKSGSSVSPNDIGVEVTVRPALFMLNSCKNYGAGVVERRCQC
jgi:hypothetical protein